MFVEFNVKNLLGSIPVTLELKQYYEKLIQAIAENFSEFMDISNVEKIIIPDNFVADVLEYQSLLHIENFSVTNNEFGRAFGKMIHDKNTNKYIVFLDPDYAAFLMEDIVFDGCFKNLDEEKKKEAHIIRRQALNLLAHEFAHVENDLHLIRPEFTTDYESQIESLLYCIFDEYYACRRSSKVSSEAIIPYEEKYINDIEQKVMDEKWKYKTHQVELDTFCNVFHKLTKQCLIGMVSVLGSVGEKKTEQQFYERCKLGFVVDDFKKEFDKMYNAFLNGKTITIPSVLASCVNNYFESFGVYISQKPEGMYYHIPDE